MAEKLVYDLNHLDRLVSSLEKAHGQMLENSLYQADVSTMATQTAATAMNTFNSKWMDNHRTMRGSLKDVKKLARTAAEEFERVDRELSESVENCIDD